MSATVHLAPTVPAHSRRPLALVALGGSNPSRPRRSIPIRCRSPTGRHRLAGEPVIWVGCTFEPMARGFPHGEHHSYEQEEVPMNAQTPTPDAAKQRYVRLAGAAIEERPDASARRRRGRFSTGNEQRPDAPAKFRLGRYSEGAEQLPDSPRKHRIGRFSMGIEQRPDAPDKQRRGSFADGYATYK
jgi:hypothetical protein